MARAAEHRTKIDDSIDTPVGYDKKKLWDACYVQWTKEWQQNSTVLVEGKKYSTPGPRPDKNKTKKLLRHSRAYMHRLIECTTGHNNLNYLQSKIYPEDWRKTQKVGEGITGRFVTAVEQRFN